MLPLPPRSTLFPYTTLFRSSIAADLDKRRAAVPRRVAGLVAFDEAQVVKPRVRGIENSESVLPRLDGQVGPDLPVYENRLTKEFSGRTNGGIGIHERSVRSDVPILDDEGNLVDARREVKGIFDLVTQDVHAGQAHINVQPRDADRMVVIPERRRPLIIRVVVDAVLEERTCPREVSRGPRVGVSIVVRKNPEAVHVHDGSHRGLVRFGAVYGGIDRQDMRRGQGIPPQHSDGDTSSYLERRPWARAVIAPQRCRRQIAMQLLLEGNHRDVVDRHPVDSVRDRHGGWDWKRINERLNALHELPRGWGLMRTLRRRGASHHHRAGSKSSKLHELTASHQRARRNRGVS